MPQAQRAVMPGPREITFETYDVPEPGAGQLLIQTEASAISAGTELAIYTGIHQWLGDPTRAWPKFPFVPGYSAVGRVAAIGEGVSGFDVGDRVIWAGRHESHALFNTHVAGSSAAPIWRIGEDVPAPAAACAVLTRFPFTALVRTGQILGQAVAILGLGTIGQITTRLYTATGAFPIFGIDPVAARRRTADLCPGVTTIDPTDADLRTVLRELNDGQLPDVVVDATGAPNAVRTAMSIVADGGTVVMVGSPRGIAGDVDFYWDLHGRSISLVGAHGSAIGDTPREKFPFVRDRAFRLIVHLLESRKLRLEDVITHHVHTNNLRQMYDGLLDERDTYLGVTLHW